MAGKRGSLARRGTRDTQLDVTLHQGVLLFRPQPELPARGAQYGGGFGAVGQERLERLLDLHTEADGDDLAQRPAAPDTDTGHRSVLWRGGGDKRIKGRGGGCLVAGVSEPGGWIAGVAGDFRAQ